jgi:hypothetical protein
MFDWRFADMNKDQAVIAKLIQRFAVKKYRTER